ncbi:MAG: gamma-glutamyl-gamma-aminobutyrate hydrolase family protein [bacterium]|nr:gamma-glutamyl-gamma-aminobutyrate hydrolase family protein [bacterium]
MPAPLIGITTYGRDERGRFTLPGEYVDCVRRAGGLALCLAPGEPDPARWLARLDGIVFCGGGDLAPEAFGGTSSEITRDPDPERDRTELELARLVLDEELPSLWICRGLQLLNVVRGGTLIEHLPDAVGTRVTHDLPPHEPVVHELAVDAGSRLAHTLGATALDGVSWHHQAIEALGSGLHTVARAVDGVIEAVELADAPWCQAVQWHPELSAAEDPVQRRLFDALLASATGRC